MAKVKSAARAAYRCDRCGHLERKWLGRCPACQEWNSLIEEISAEAPSRGASGAADGAKPRAITDIDPNSGDGARRLATGIGEFDRVLGGGLVEGSVILLGGEPGIGKSTLLTQALAEAARVAAAARPGATVLYASGEESVAQTAMRARRLGAIAPGLHIVAETDVDKILHHAREARPALLAIDSVQTVFTTELDSIPGSLAQVRECAGRLLAFAKTTGTPTIMVGHVTKDGALAGPKTLEHMVDVVLQFEGEAGAPYRVLRGHKNRFGSTHEVGVFEMHGQGLREVENPSAMFLAERPVGAPGSIVVAAADGHRPILVEVQALVAPAAAGVGRRTAAGVDGNRVALLLAVLAQRANCDVIVRDVFVNVAGGMRLSEPAADLGIACAIASSARGRAVDGRTIVFGEVGLAGEVRAVSLCDQRLMEASRLGFNRVILPKQNRARCAQVAGVELVGVDRLAAALDLL